jgi:ribosomal protein RSM22 (predicted rRNA methylase)
VIAALPPGLSAALESRLHGLSLNDVAKRQAEMSQTYRSGGGSVAIRSEADALAYALARMPATYAAVAACLTAIAEIAPDFAPATLLDCGAGPGTATWAAASWIAARGLSLERLTLLDSNAALRRLALALAEETATPIDYSLGDAGPLIDKVEPADLVVASYVINELDAIQRDRLADALWARTTGLLLVIEPGTPTGYERIIALRRRLIEQGAHVVAPCPHDNACPLNAPDWCHFVQRLPRSRAHMALKGANVPFEDEKFSYVALARSVPIQHPARVLAQPQSDKAGITAKLCTPDGLRVETAPKRDKAAYRRFRKLDWGDVVPPAEQ